MKISTEITVYVQLNTKLNGIELSFSEKPSSDVLFQLKRYGFHWHREKRIWWAKIFPDRLQFVREYFNVNL